VFDYLERTPRGKNDELQLTDALRLLASDRAIYGVRCEGKRHDVGNKLDFIKTSVLYGLRRQDIGDSLSRWIKELAQGL
jgi:UTP--glucose-1-phosphate uridylyltransferase